MINDNNTDNINNDNNMMITNSYNARCPPQVQLYCRCSVQYFAK